MNQLILSIEGFLPPPLAGVWRLFSGVCPVLEVLLPLEALLEPGVEGVGRTGGPGAGGRAGGRKPGTGEAVLDGAAEDDWDPGVELA